MQGSAQHQAMRFTACGCSSHKRKGLSLGGRRRSQWRGAGERIAAVLQHVETFFAQAEDAAGADLQQFVKDEFDALFECGILAHGFLRLLVASPSAGAPVRRC